MDQLPGTLKTLYKSAKNTVLQVPEIERKVKEATSNEKWGPTGTQMRELSRATHSYHDLPLIMGTIWRRLNDHGKYWRHVYKSLLLVDYLLKNGADQVLRECRDNIIQIQTLTEFQYVEEDKDVGLSVRERAKAIVELIHDEKRLKTEREKAKSTSKKFSVAVGSEKGSQGGGGYDYDDRNESYDRERDRDRERERERDSDRDREREREKEKDDSDDERERDREREREKERERRREKEREDDRPRSNSSRTTTTRPRAPSGGGGSAPVTSQSQPQSTPNIFDFDAPAPQQKPAFDFFNQPVQQSNSFNNGYPQQQQGFQQTGFQSGSQQGGFQSNSQQQGFQQPRSNDFFDPRGNSGTPQQQVQQNTSASDWAEFSGADDSKKEVSYDPNDPWSHAHLFDLDKSKQNQASSTSSSNSAPMGAMGGKPMGPGKPVTTTIPALQTPVMTNPGMGRGTPVFQQPGVFVNPQMAINPLTGQPVMIGQPMMGQPMMGQPMMGQQPVFGQPQLYGQQQVFIQPQQRVQSSSSNNGLLF